MTCSTLNSMQELGEDEEIEDLDDELDDDLDDETASELKAVDEALSQKEQNAKSLAIRACPRRACGGETHARRPGLPRRLS